MAKAYDIAELIGKTYGRLKILRVSPTNKGELKKVVCECLCGQGEKVISLSSLISGNTKTCGCGDIPPIGTTHESKQYGKFQVIDYTKEFDSRGSECIRMVVRFLDTGFEKVCAPKEVRLGSVKDPTRPSIAGIGFIGDGKYVSKGKDMVCYQTWSDMIKRCYSPKSERVAREYNGVIVCNEWHDFQNFAKWYYDHFIIGYHMDKDLRVFGSKRYSPETCTFIPLELNSFLTGGLKRGIHFSNSKGKWVAQCQDGEKTRTGNKKQTYLGAYVKEEDALDAYKTFKLSKLDQLESKYGDSLPRVIFDNIRNFLNELK